MARYLLHRVCPLWYNSITLWRHFLRVLLITFTDWFGPLRIPRALKRAGFDVAILCNAKSLVAKTRFVDRLFLHSQEEPTRETFPLLLKAIRETDPGLLLVGDETAARYLEWICRKASRRGASKEMRDVGNLIRRSRGPIEQFAAYNSKQLAMKAAREAGIPTPRQVVDRSWREAFQAANSIGYPVVVKRDRGYGGNGVAMCANDEELRDALLRFLPHGWEEHAKAWGRSILDRTFRGVNSPRLLPLSIEAFIPGATCVGVFVALEGEYLAGFTIHKMHTFPRGTGPASVIEILERPDIEQATRRFIRHIQYSGFGGIEFQSEELTGKAHFIEFNSRLIPTSHLGEKIGVNLCGALLDALNNRATAPTSAKKGLKIALFPAELLRDPGSEFVNRDHLDAPWDNEPVLNGLAEKLNEKALAVLRRMRAERKTLAGGAK